MFFNFRIDLRTNINHRLLIDAVCKHPCIYCLHFLKFIVHNYFQSHQNRYKIHQIGSMTKKKMRKQNLTQFYTIYRAMMITHINIVFHTFTRTFKTAISVDSHMSLSR